ncbi:hypothetical protein NQ317_019500 [Molorchus minor]|uniref:Uncharacterized protein n=1 Tax=Molorchus minor TaxID=1323400 RepID=A0ABQ9JA44_9CUCU|nr:hypothetical protein NQ317_019500 [Molorchus minor]
MHLTFDSFTLGRFVSFTTDGCPDGALQISESNRPQVGAPGAGHLGVRQSTIAKPIASRYSFTSIVFQEWKRVTTSTTAWSISF